MDKLLNWEAKMKPIYFALYVIGLSSILSCSGLRLGGTRPEKLRATTYEEDDGGWLDDIEYDDEGFDEGVYDVDDECIMSTRTGGWDTQADSIKASKKK